VLFINLEGAVERLGIHPGAQSAWGGFRRLVSHQIHPLSAIKFVLFELPTCDPCTCGGQDYAHKWRFDRDVFGGQVQLCCWGVCFGDSTRPRDGGLGGGWDAWGAVAFCSLGGVVVARGASCTVTSKRDMYHWYPKRMRITRTVAMIAFRSILDSRGCILLGLWYRVKPAGVVGVAP